MWQVRRWLLGLTAAAAVGPSGCFDIKIDVSDRVHSQINNAIKVGENAVKVADQKGDGFLKLGNDFAAQIDRMYEGMPEKAGLVGRAVGTELELSLKRGTKYAEYRLAKRLRMLLAAMTAEKAKNPKKKVSGEHLASVLQAALDEVIDPPFVQALAADEVVIDGPAVAADGDVLLAYSGWGLAGDGVQVVVGSADGAERPLDAKPLGLDEFHGRVRVPAKYLAGGAWVGLRYGPRSFDLVRSVIRQPHPYRTAELVLATLDKKSTLVHVDVEVRQAGRVLHRSEPQAWPPAGFAAVNDSAEVQGFYTKSPADHGIRPPVPSPFSANLGRQLYEQAVAGLHHNVVADGSEAYTRIDDQQQPTGDRGEHYTSFYFKRDRNRPAHTAAFGRDVAAWKESVAATDGRTGLFCGRHADPNSPPLRHPLPPAAIDWAQPIDVVLHARGARAWSGLRLSLALTTAAGQAVVIDSPTPLTLTPNTASAQQTVKLTPPATK